MGYIHHIRGPQQLIVWDGRGAIALVMVCGTRAIIMVIFAFACGSVKQLSELLGAKTRLDRRRRPLPMDWLRFRGSDFLTAAGWSLPIPDPRLFLNGLLNSQHSPQFASTRHAPRRRLSIMWDCKLFYFKFGAKLNAVFCINSHETAERFTTMSIMWLVISGQAWQINFNLNDYIWIVYRLKLNL